MGGVLLRRMSFHRLVGAVGVVWVVCLSEAEWLLLKRVLAEHIERHGRTAMSDAGEAMLEGAFTYGSCGR